MKKKIIILIFLIFMLCGCTAEVNVDINSNTIDEIVSIYAYPNEYYNKEQLKTAFRQYIPAFGKDMIIDAAPDEKASGISYYQRTLKDLGTGYRFDYSYKFNLSNYKGARTVKEGFKSSNIYVDNKEKTILISTDNGGLLFFNQYPELTDVTINIKTGYKVKENNADIINGSVYTWKLNRDDRKNIYLLLDTSVNEEEKDNKNEVINDVNNKEEDSEVTNFFNEHPVLIIFISFCSFILVVFIISKVTRIKYR